MSFFTHLNLYFGRNEVISSSYGLSRYLDSTTLEILSERLVFYPNGHVKHMGVTWIFEHLRTLVLGFTEFYSSYLELGRFCTYLPWISVLNLHLLPHHKKLLDSIKLCPIMCCYANETVLLSNLGFNNVTEELFLPQTLTTKESTKSDLPAITEKSIYSQILHRPTTFIKVEWMTLLQLIAITLFFVTQKSTAESSISSSPYLLLVHTWKYALVICSKTVAHRYCASWNW